jgi:oligogalacturonide transporter
MFLYALLWMTDMGYWYYLGTYLSIELLSAMVLVRGNAGSRNDKPL